MLISNPLDLQCVKSSSSSLFACRENAIILQFIEKTVIAFPVFLGIQNFISSSRSFLIPCCLCNSVLSISAEWNLYVRLVRVEILAYPWPIFLVSKSLLLRSYHCNTVFGFQENLINRFIFLSFFILSSNGFIDSLFLTLTLSVNYLTS